MSEYADPALSYRHLREFKAKLERKFTSMREAFLKLDVDRDGWIGVPEFRGILYRCACRRLDKAGRALYVVRNVRNEAVCKMTVFAVYAFSGIFAMFCFWRP